MKNTKHLLHSGWQFRQQGHQSWQPATVPGCVHLDLMAMGQLDDPFTGTNENRCQWVGYKEWHYTCTFSAPAPLLAHKAQYLVCEGLDTFASVFLNGYHILEASNMHRTWRVPVGEALKAGENVLMVRFRSAINEPLKALAQLDYRYHALQDDAQGASALARKAPYHYGWDWGPRLVTAGIWRPMYLEGYSTATLQHTHVRQLSLTHNMARLEAQVALDAPIAGTCALQVLHQGQALAEATVDLPAGQSHHTLPFEIENPQRWWPAGYGAPHLYPLELRLLQGEKIIDAHTTRIGLRTLELKREQDSAGESFAFVVNGVPVFAKGANWIPADSFINRVSPARYRHLLEAAQAAHFNMLRVWGGGVFEEDAFYDLCDELGILVWQDFLFACSLFPGDRKFLDNVAAECTDNIVRLRNHPCLALWCGDNENEWIFDFNGQGMQQRFGSSPREVAAFKADYQALNNRLRQLVETHDPDRAYWPSSPSSHGQHPDPNAEGVGDVHHWDIWHLGQPIAGYRSLKPRFISEFGFQGMPHERTVNDYTPQAQRFIGSPVMDTHQKHARGYELIQHYLGQHYPPPKDFAAYVYLTQVQQADFVSLAVEHFRSQSPHCMGVLYWQFNDCWPVCSWASVDYQHRWKALHYAARRFYAPVMVSAVQEQGQVHLYGVADGPQAPEELQLRWSLRNFEGKVLAAGAAPAPLQAQKALRLETLALETLLPGQARNSCYLHCALWAKGKPVAQNRLFFEAPKALALPPATLALSPEHVEGNLYRLTLEASAFAKNVYLHLAEGTAHFSDNFFDLEPHTPVQVTFRPEQGAPANPMVQGYSMVDVAAP